MAILSAYRLLFDIWYSARRVYIPQMNDEGVVENSSFKLPLTLSNIMGEKKTDERTELVGNLCA